MTFVRITAQSRKYTALFLALTLFSLGLVPFLAPSVNAANIFTLAKVTISDSRAGHTPTTYDFAYTTTVTTAIKQFDVIFCTTASGTCTTPTDMITTAAVRASDNIAGTDRVDTFMGNGILSTVVTTPASQATQAIAVSYTGITNPSPINTTFFARVTTYSDTGTTVIDSASVAFAILTTTSIAVTASVDPTFAFSIAGVAASTSVNGATTNVVSTATTIPFGTLSSGSTKIAAHDISVTTNSLNGYTVTVKATVDPPLVDVSNNIDKFSGTNASPIVWSSPAGTAASVNTGFFGYTTNDAVLGTGTTDRFTSTPNVWAGVTTSPLEVAFSAVGAPSAEVTRVGWQAEVNTLQPSGSYTGTVVLVATPTY